MIITEGIYADDTYSQAAFNQPGLVNEEQMRGWQKIGTEVKNHDTLFIAQLMHAGALSRTLAPSAVLPTDAPEGNTKCRMKPFEPA